jgi:hypothetical protein
MSKRAETYQKYGRIAASLRNIELEFIRQKHREKPPYDQEKPSYAQESRAELFSTIRTVEGELLRLGIVYVTSRYLEDMPKGEWHIFSNNSLQVGVQKFDDEYLLGKIPPGMDIQDGVHYPNTDLIPNPIP